MEDNLLQKFKDRAKSIQDIDESITDVQLIKFEKQNIVHNGMIIISNYDEKLDNHCIECQEEIIPFKFKSIELGTYFTISMGKSKFDKLKSGKINTKYFKIKIIESLL